jgi:hypothetical protein
VTEGTEGRAPTGEFLPGSEAAKQAGHKGGLHAQGKKTEEEVMQSGRDEEGKFVPGSEVSWKPFPGICGLALTLIFLIQAAKAAGHKGGLAAAANNGN